VLDESSHELLDFGGGGIQTLAEAAEVFICLRKSKSLMKPLPDVDS
jgi:hypothetical protein